LIRSEPVIVVFGPTAVGKTAFLENLFSRITHFEIINADSMQVYRYMNVGTAKPSDQLRERIPHHLIDIVEPTFQFNAGQFVRRAERLLPEIRRRGKTPILCGGTAYYLRSFITGLPDSPPGDPSIRRALKRELEERGGQPLLDELARVDPDARARVKDQDTYRIVRALEVYRSSGRPLSSFTNPNKPREGYAFLLLGLKREREQLYTRIGERVELMFRSGLVEEVNYLLSKGFGSNDPGMRGIGYREFFDLQKGCLTLGGVKEVIKRNSRRYAKRQITFFKSLEGVVWESPDDLDSASSRITEFLVSSTS
jgi:tRNA dimethylallyltransferase